MTWTTSSFCSSSRPAQNLLHCEFARNSKDASVQQQDAALIGQLRVNTAKGRKASTSKKEAVLHSSSDAFFCICALMYLLQCNWLLKRDRCNFSANLHRNSRYTAAESLFDTEACQTSSNRKSLIGTCSGTQNKQNHKSHFKHTLPIHTTIRITGY